MLISKDTPRTMVNGLITIADSIMVMAEEWRGGKWRSGKWRSGELINIQWRGNLIGSNELG